MAHDFEDNQDFFLVRGDPDDAFGSEQEGNEIEPSLQRTLAIQKSQYMS